MNLYVAIEMGGVELWRSAVIGAQDMPGAWCAFAPGVEASDRVWRAIYEGGPESALIVKVVVAEPGPIP